MESPSAQLLRALNFAARKHRDQRRKGAAKAPYINHVIDVAHLLAGVGQVADLPLLQAAILHDTLEDTNTTQNELEKEFGTQVGAIVAAVTDDKSLPFAERKRLQVQHAQHLSPAAKQLKIADKISNISELAPGEPPEWTPQRRREYLDWAEQVVARCRGANRPLEEYFARVLAVRRTLLASEG